MYVSDSLFFIQHIVAQQPNDENRQLFAVKYREIIDDFNDPKPKETADEIRERILNKSRLLTGG